MKTKIATDWGAPKPDGILVRLMQRFIPEANPSYRNKMHLIDTWYIEFDKQGLPNREVGVDADGLPVVAGPSSTDYGFWLDSNITDVDLEGLEIERKEFEALWFRTGIDS
ncbi:MAG: hypothetical protein AAFN50_03040 [Pseudomonadota bacterium]